jgi:hypothetical protein
VEFSAIQGVQHAALSTDENIPFVSVHYFKNWYSLLLKNNKWNILADVHFLFGVKSVIRSFTVLVCYLVRAGNDVPI